MSYRVFFFSPPCQNTRASSFYTLKDVYAQVVLIKKQTYLHFSLIITSLFALCLTPCQRVEAWRGFAFRAFALASPGEAVSSMSHEGALNLGTIWPCVHATHIRTRAYMEDIQELYSQHFRARGSSRISSVDTN